jgi:hypothetical protein
MDDRKPPESLSNLEQLLDRLLSAVQVGPTGGLEREVKRYVEEAIEAAMAASGRARESGLGERVAPQIGETVAVAQVLLKELHASTRRSWAIVDQSLELRRRAIQLTAKALSLSTRASELASAAAAPPVERPDLLQHVRVLVIGDRGADARRFETLLTALGAEVHAVPSPDRAVDAARMFHPEALLCFVPFPAAESLICDLRREGVIAPALAVADLDDSLTRSAARMSGFFDILRPGASLASLVQAVRAALGA